jgi:hypothetical protein
LIRQQREKRLAEQRAKDEDDEKKRKEDDERMQKMLEVEKMMNEVFFSQKFILSFIGTQEKRRRTSQSYGANYSPEFLSRDNITIFKKS